MTAQGHPPHRTRLPAVHESLLPREHALHRPRHGSKQLGALIAACVFFVTPVLSWTLGARVESFENRPLAEFPSLSQGWGFFTGFSQWATDHLVFRQDAVRAADGISKGLFGEPAPLDRGQQQGPVGGVQTSTPDVPKQQVPVDQQQALPGFTRVVAGKDDWLFFGLDFQAKCKPDKTIDDTLSRIRRLKQVVEASGRGFLLLVPPDKSTVEPGQLPASYGGKECAAPAATEFWNKFSVEPGVVDVRPILAETKKRLGKPVYHKQDTHWGDEGAVAAVRELAERLQPGVTAPWSVSLGESYSSPADLAGMIGQSGQNAGFHYEVKPNGTENRAKGMNATFSTPIPVTTSQLPGMLPGQVVVFGDSFLVSISRYLPAAMSGFTVQHYGYAVADPVASGKTAANNDVVVFEAVERNLTSGTAGFLSNEFIEAFGKELAAKPRPR
ncbi:alginate O-acetyltransferase AlgX-related protein [Crossiella sp. CA198]|uniref:alginate O-acetyltransferase AlgX-related protein n=1 Tax=Crossiella sp. CA198 TaxID=3455607 RepID=UPI003F8D695C